ncbi:hypothetical protein ABZ801_41295 [Actinomadura sp. NPDC047616]
MLGADAAALGGQPVEAVVAAVAVAEHRTDAGRAQRRNVGVDALGRELE